jgi:hypothetical protein
MMSEASVTSFRIADVNGRETSRKFLKRQGSPCIDGNSSCIISDLAFDIPAGGRVASYMGWKEGRG